jgi:hypothetical protein
MRHPETPTRAGRWFYRIALATALTVGLLQMYHVRAGLLTNYGADVFGTMWLYAMTRLGWTVVQRGRTASPQLSAAIVFFACGASEFGQRLHWVPGYYDPWDVIAFGLSVVASVALERAIGPFAMPTATTKNAT